MKDKVKKLIQSGRSLNDTSKKMYLKLVDFLSEDKLKQLAEIFENEEKKCAEIERAVKTKKTNTNKAYIAEMGNLFKEEQKKAMQSEETEEKAKGDEVLKQLDNL
ncbi:MAG: hypothetical protein AAB848_02485 [Patescibacteria group bacterium]